MLFKCVMICLCLLRFISCDKSLTIVLDTTYSMQEELDVLKGNLGSVLNVSDNNDISNYILVPFRDPDVGEPIVAQTPRELLSAINGITVRGGRTCPENSLAGIEKALQISNAQSNIFVFTDAYSKDASKLGSVENLCRRTGSQVVIFLSGYCNPSNSSAVSVQTYYDVANVCSGAVVRFDPATLRQAFRYIREVTNVQWTDVINFDTFTTYKQLSFSVSSFTKTVLLVVSGEYPTLQISAPDGTSLSSEKLIDTRHTQVLRLTEPPPGEYTVVIRCSGQTSLSLYKKYELPLRFGFSTKLPRSLRETSRRPMPGRSNYMLIDVSQSKLKLESVEIQVIDELEKKVLVLEDRNNSLYITSLFVEPNKAFRIWVQGYDTSSYQQVKVSSENVLPQQGSTIESRWTRPRSEMLEPESVTIDFGTNTTFACKVTGYPTPSILWEDDNGVSLPSESVLLEMPSVYISYVSIENVTTNSTIYCKSKNSEGEDTQSMNVYFHRPYTFDVIQTPTDQTIEFGSEGRLYCEVSSYPAAEIKWYFNGTEVNQYNEMQVDLETNDLWIRNMTASNVGEYKCEVTNEAKSYTYTAFVSISGIEAPKVEAEKTDIILKLGDWSYLECRVIKGKPSPVITWTYKSEDGFDFGSLPEGVVADDGRLKIGAAQSEHKGTYRCDAANMEGHHSADITVQLKYAPIISVSDSETLIVKEEDDVVLPCVVDASPEARVSWEIPRRDENRHHTDNRHTLRFKALWKDSGDYHCTAENDVGRSQKTVTVNVLVAPYIEAPKQKTVVARTGDNVVLMCNVKYGNPVPFTKWKFIALDSTTKVLSRNSSSPLYLKNVSYTNEGSYLCIADNEIGTDSIQIYVKIQ